MACSAAPAASPTRSSVYTMDDPLLLFPGCAGAFFATLAAVDVLGAGRTSKRWCALTRNVVGGRAARGEGPVALGLLVRAADCDDGACPLECALRALTRDARWAPELCVAFHSGEPPDVREACANCLPKECAVVASGTADGVIGPDADGVAGECFRADQCPGTPFNFTST